MDDGLQNRAKAILAGLRKAYPDARVELNFGNPFQLLIATILAAQCTDERVNKVTAELFAKWPAPEDYVDLSSEELEESIHSTGYYRNKAKSILACCKQLVERHSGQMPGKMDQLVELTGVGRKTANVVLGSAMSIASGIVVDTHVKRVAVRLGLSQQTDGLKLEKELMELVPQTEWIFFSHSMILHGRRVCRAKKPDCDGCMLAEICPRIGVADVKAG